MRGTSGASLEQARERFEPVLRAAGADGLTLGEQLFALTDALDSSTALCRVFADPSGIDEDKVRLAQSLLASFDERVQDLFAGMVRSRWAHDADLPDAVELLGIDAALAAAQSRGALEQVEDELFRLSRALIGQRDAREALSDERIDPQRRRGLVAGILGNRGDAVTSMLAEHATFALRGRRFVPTLGWFGELAAERRRRLVASVFTAVPLTRTQLDRLAGLLERAYGRAVQVNVTVDPAVLGGMRIQVGADVVDSTTLSRLAEARRRLAS